MPRLFLLALSAFIVVASPISAIGSDRPSFEAWLEEFRREALERGISDQVVQSALSDVQLIERAIKNDRNQAEFVETYDDYLKRYVSEWRINTGRQLYSENRALLARVGEAYGVQPRFIAAIWGVESSYGKATLGYRVIDAIATLAYDPRRSDRFRNELFGVLEILDKGYARQEQLMGSWAGAMGQPQFMPIMYLTRAQDFDGDGRRDIWSSEADIFASIANYLRHAGWRADQTWGRPVQVPTDIRKRADNLSGIEPDRPCQRFTSLGKTLRLSQWQSLGVRRADGRDLPGRDLKAALILPEEGAEHGWIVYRNFCSIMAYNPAFKYALGVGLLSDAISEQ